MSRDLPLSGVRVLDLGWITAGAGTSALLADLGADVVKVEGPTATDPFRLWEGSDPDSEWWNLGPFYNYTNRHKRSLCLDLKDPRGQKVMSRLLDGADVLVENFRRGVLASLGLDAGDLRVRFPRLVIASISSQGEDGPDRDMVSYGSTLEATGGLAALTGTGERPVISGRDLNYPDQVVCLFAAGAVVAALRERNRTGVGAHLDMSQRELTSFLIGEELVAAAEGGISTRWGNTDPNEPDERLVNDGDGWRVVFPGGEAPVRRAADLVRSDAISHGTALRPCVDGSLAKGSPFRFDGEPLDVGDPCHPLGADNRAILAEIGISTDEIAELERAGVIATRPRKEVR
jgi:crotonobetainyl-CoA:carnitine CoA-transferase CaiB-like acyl-CoA transferase